MMRVNDVLEHIVHGISSPMETTYIERRIGTKEIGQ